MLSTNYLPLPVKSLNDAAAVDDKCLLVRPTLAWLDIAKGLVDGVTTVNKFGRNKDVGTTFTPVCMGGVYRTPQIATKLRIKAGGSVNDSSAGSGARSVTLIGLDQSFNEITETIATNGALASTPTTLDFTRLFRAYVASSGTYATALVGSHTSDIVIENAAGSSTFATIDSSGFPKSQSEIGAFSMRAGSTAFVKLKNLSIDSGKTVDLIFFTRGGINQTSAPYSAMRAQSILSGVTGGSIESFGESSIPLGPYIGPHDIGFMAKVSVGTAAVSVEFEIYIVDA